MYNRLLPLTDRLESIMNKAFQTKLFADLMALRISNPGSFLYKDCPVEGNPNQAFRIFNYSIPKYSEFMQPGALNCRGTMFFMDNGEPTLVALPMEKFFTLGETPESRNVDYTKAKHAYMKEDGSLLTSYISPVTNTLQFKSKNNPTFQDKEVAIEKAINQALFAELEKLTRAGVSVDLELTTPENRVFIDYLDYAVHVLKARSLETGEYVDIRSEQFANDYPVIAKHLVKQIPVADININQNGIEGYVVEDENGTMYKVKTIPYLKMSAYVNMQDQTKERKYLYAAVIYETADEIRSLYNYRKHSDNFPIDEIMRKIDEVEAYAQLSYHSMIQRVESFYEENKHLERGDYARKAKDMSELMPVLIQKYLGRPVDYKESAVNIYAGKNIQIPPLSKTV